MIDYRLGFGLFFLFGGLLTLLGGVEQRHRRGRLLRRAVRVEARIVSVKTEYAGDDGGRDIHVPTVEFQVAGTLVQAPTIAGRANAAETHTGKRIEVWYDPHDHTRVVLAPNDWPSGGWATFLGLVTAVIGAGLVWIGLTNTPR